MKVYRSVHAVSKRWMGVRLEWCNCWAAQRSGVRRVFHNSAIAYPLRFESLLPSSPERASGSGTSLNMLPDLKCWFADVRF